MTQKRAPEFSRPVSVDTLRDRGEATLSAQADPQERAALAARYGVQSVEALSVDAALRPDGGGWVASGEARARLIQLCGVTLEPVPEEVIETFERRFSPDVPARAPTHEVEMRGEDDPEPLGAQIDIGEIAAEAVALGIDPWPRAPDVDFSGALKGPPGADPLTDEAARPFAGLSALKKRMEGG